MSEPILLIVAGCNGSGKSSFSKSLVPPGFVPFDYDIYFLKFYKSLIDSDIKEEMAHNMAFAELEKQIQHAIAHKINFCYETNFNSTPLYWPKLFKQNGYILHIIYLCLDSIALAKRRVEIRVANGGHFVPEDEIEKRYLDGFANLNKHFNYFNIVDIFDSSEFSKEPNYILTIEHDVTAAKRPLPDYLVHLIPDINRKLQK